MRERVRKNCGFDAGFDLSKDSNMWRETIDNHITLCGKSNLPYQPVLYYGLDKIYGHHYYEFVAKVKT